jgi:isoprenylcysteine carboxyl methyltransferase (ICMT) family protein YpbQ
MEKISVPSFQLIPTNLQPAEGEISGGNKHSITLVTLFVHSTFYLIMLDWVYQQRQTDLQVSIFVGAVAFVNNSILLRVLNTLLHFSFILCEV